MILRAYEYVFYRLFRFQQSRWGTRGIPAQWSAFLLVVIITSWNVLTLLALIEALLHRGTILPKFSRPEIYAAAALFALPQYFILLHRQRFEHIVHKFADESPRDRHVRGIAVLLYVLLSFPLLICASTSRPTLPQ
jgi:hypothetical protein